MLKQEPGQAERVAVADDGPGRVADAQANRLSDRTNVPLLRGSGPRQWLLVAAGVAAVALGTIGIVVPLLPTTPFLLLAAACFVRSSDRLYLWLIGHRWFGPYIKSYREHRAISGRIKLATLTLLWASIGYAVVWHVQSFLARGVLLVIAVSVTVHVLRLRTMPKGGGEPEPT